MRIVNLFCVSFVFIVSHSNAVQLDHVTEVTIGGVFCQRKQSIGETLLILTYFAFFMVEVDFSLDSELTMPLSLVTA